MPVGDKIKMDSEKQRYTVQAFDGRYVIMTKPFNARKTYLYTIADLETYRRGPIGLVFGLPDHVNTPDGAASVLKMMNGKGWQVSRRKSIPLGPGEVSQLLDSSRALSSQPQKGEWPHER